MRYFREVRMRVILILNFILGLITGRFMRQAFCFILGLYARDGIFWRVLGVQYATLIFLVVFFINQFVWKKKRVMQPRTKDDLPLLSFRLALTILVYALGALAVHLPLLLS